MVNDDLVFLATSRSPGSRVAIDKYLAGYFTIQFMTQSTGPVFVAYDDRQWTIEGEWFWPAFPGVRTRFHPTGQQVSWFHRHIGFQGPLVGRWQAAGLWMDAPQKMPATHDEQYWVTYFDETIYLVRRGDAWARLRAINRIEGLLLELAEARAANTPDDWLARILEKLEAVQCDAPDYDKIANDLGLSLTALRRKFKSTMGVPLHGWVLQNRVARARTLLAESDLPIKAIAAQLGYNNVYFFARQFKQIAGVSPGHFRKSRL